MLLCATTTMLSLYLQLLLPISGRKACLSTLSHRPPQLQLLQEQIMQLFSTMPQLQHCTISSRSYSLLSSLSVACSSNSHSSSNSCGNSSISSSNSCGNSSISSSNSCGNSSSISSSNSCGNSSCISSSNSSISSVDGSLGCNQQTSPGTLPPLSSVSSSPASFTSSRGSGASSSSEAILTAVRPFPSSPVHVINGALWISAAQPLVTPPPPSHHVALTEQPGTFLSPPAIPNDEGEHHITATSSSSSSSSSSQVVSSTTSAGYGMEHPFLSLGSSIEPMTNSLIPQDQGQALVSAAGGGARQLHLSLSSEPEHDGFGLDHRRFTRVSLPPGVSVLLSFCHSLTLQCEKLGSSLSLQGIQKLPSSCFVSLRRLAMYGVLPEAPAEVALAAFRAACCAAAAPAATAPAAAPAAPPPAPPAAAAPPAATAAVWGGWACDG